MHVCTQSTYVYVGTCVRIHQCVCMCIFFPKIYPVISYEQCQMATITQVGKSYTLHVATTKGVVEKAT
jgi:hypothetical protein